MAIHASNDSKKRNCPFIAMEVMEREILPPSRMWVSHFFKRNGLHIVVAQSVERPRCLSCDKSTIIGYLLKWTSYFNRDPRLMFGADKIDIKPGQRQKIIAPVGIGGYVADHPQDHITVMCAHSASGIGVLPMIVLAHGAQPTELTDCSISNPNICWFALTSSG